MKDEKLRILQMIKDGTISPQEGLDLIEALESTEGALVHVSTEPGTDEQPPTEEDSVPGRKRKPRYLYIKVDDQESGKNVNIRIPISLAKFAGKFIPKHAKHRMHEHGVDIDIEGLMEMLEKEGEQNLVEVTEGEKKTVRIYTE